MKSSAVAAFQPAPEDKMMRSLNSLPRDESEIAIVQHIESISSFLYETVQVPMCTVRSQVVLLSCCVVVSYV